jgi:hypothetical protein
VAAGAAAAAAMLLAPLLASWVHAGAGQCSGAHTLWGAALRAEALDSFEAERHRLIAAGVPRRLRSEEASRLLHSGRLSPGGLVAAAGGLTWNGTRWSEGRFFGLSNGGATRFPDRRGAGSALQIEDTEDLSPAQFFAFDRGASGGENASQRRFVYFTAPLSQLAPSLLAEEGLVHEWHWALSETSAPPRLGYAGGPLVRPYHARPHQHTRCRCVSLQCLWQVRLSGPGATCQAHWDSKHNVFISLHGRKRFYLWPTEALPSLRLHSAAHALYPKSMINFDAPPDVTRAHLRGGINTRVGTAAAADADADAADADDDDDDDDVVASLASAMVVELRPGEVLYLPPLIPHHVECAPPLRRQQQQDEQPLGWAHCVGLNVCVI